MAMVLDPRQKYKYFYRHWFKKYLPGMKAKVEAMFEEFRINDNTATSSLIAESQSQSNKRRKLEGFDINNFHFGHQNVQKSELKRYLKAPVLSLLNDENDLFDVMEW